MMEGGDDNFDLRRPDNRRARVYVVPDPPTDSGESVTATEDPEGSEAATRPAPLRKTSSRVTVPRAPLTPEPASSTPPLAPASETLAWREGHDNSVAVPQPVASPAPPPVIASEPPAPPGPADPFVADLRRPEADPRPIRRPRRAALAGALICLAALVAGVVAVAGQHPSASTTARQPSSATPPSAEAISLSLGIASAMNTTSQHILTAAHDTELKVVAGITARDNAERKAAAERTAAAKRRAAEHRAAEHKTTHTTPQAETPSSSEAGAPSSSTDTPTEATQTPVSSSTSSGQSSSSAGSTPSTSGPTGLGTSSGCNPRCS